MRLTDNVTATDSAAKVIVMILFIAAIMNNIQAI